jgi:release factor glutamine methyltransferase
MQSDPWRPSEYTAFLLHVLETAARPLVRGEVLELGVGSGVVLAALGAMGVGSLTGTDIDTDAILRTERLLAQADCRVRLLAGDLWSPLRGRRFDFIVANPPQFPSTARRYPGRPPSWSYGGIDGRRVMDPLLAGLRDHLADGGHAVVVHSAFLGLDATRALLSKHGLGLRHLASGLMPLAPEKRAVMTPAVLEQCGSAAIRHIGDHAFLATDIIAISAATDPDG